MVLSLAWIAAQMPIFHSLDSGDNLLIKPANRFWIPTHQIEWKGGLFSCLGGKVGGWCGDWGGGESLQPFTSLLSLSPLETTPWLSESEQYSLHKKKRNYISQNGKIHPVDCLVAGKKGCMQFYQLSGCCGCPLPAQHFNMNPTPCLSFPCTATLKQHNMLCTTNFAFSLIFWHRRAILI